MKCSYYKKCSSHMMYFVAFLMLIFGIAVLGIMWHRSSGKHLSLFGIVLSQGTRNNTSKALVVAEAKNKKVIATVDDFKNILQVLEKSEPGMQFIASLPEAEQVKIYRSIINDYLITTYLIKEYMRETGADTTEEFKNEYEQFINAMSGTFYTGLFQRKINESIIINENEARSYYENARFEVSEFMQLPFAVQIPGIEARAVRIETGKEASDYATRLKNNKDVMSLGHVNRAVRGMSQRIIDALDSMKNGDVRRVELENGVSFALYRVIEHVGKWAKFEDVESQVKQVMRMKILEQRGQSILTELKQKEGIVIDEILINQIIQNKKAQDAISEGLAEIAALAESEEVSVDANVPPLMNEQKTA